MDESCNPPYKFYVTINGRRVGYVVAGGVAEAMDKAKAIYGHKAEI